MPVEADVVEEAAAEVEPVSLETESAAEPADARTPDESAEVVDAAVSDEDSDSKDGTRAPADRGRDHRRHRCRQVDGA